MSLNWFLNNFSLKVAMAFLKPSVVTKDFRLVHSRKYDVRSYALYPYRKRRKLKSVILEKPIWKLVYERL